MMDEHDGTTYRDCKTKPMVGDIVYPGWFSWVDRWITKRDWTMVVTDITTFGTGLPAIVCRWDIPDGSRIATLWNPINFHFVRRGK